MTLGPGAAWVVLVLAGLLEVTWAVSLKASEGFSKPLWSLVTVVTLAASIALLAAAARTLPIGTAYAVWVGIGAFGAAVLGMVLFREAVTVPRLVFLGLLLVSVLGLKLSSRPS